MMLEIVPATDALMSATEEWLDAEEVAYETGYRAAEASDWQVDEPVRGFRCNWDMVKRDWRDNCGAVYILVRNSKSIGFLWETDILEIRPDERGRGYGRLLADFMVKRSFDEGRSLITIEIAPSSAIPFWKRMGFTPVEARWGHGDGLYAYRRFERRLPIGAGSQVYFSIEFSTERGHFSGAAPFFRLEGMGECLPDGIVQLPERVVCFNPENTGGDDFARITVGDKVIFQDKLKRAEGARCDIQRDVGYTYFIERIRLPQR